MYDDELGVSFTESMMDEEPPARVIQWQFGKGDGGGLSGGRCMIYVPRFSWAILCRVGERGEKRGFDRVVIVIVLGREHAVAVVISMRWGCWNETACWLC